MQLRRLNGSQDNSQSEVGSGGVLSVPEEFCQIGGVGGVEPVMRRVQRSLSGGGSVERSGGAKPRSGTEPIHLPKGGANLLPHGEPAKLDGDRTNRSGSARREDQSPG